MISKLIKTRDSHTKPKWFLRQAGRHIPEYFSIRNEYNNFIDFCLNKSSIVNATILPLKYYNIDAAILFSDILLLPHFLGQKVTFKKKTGPVLKKISMNEKLKNIWPLVVKKNYINKIKLREIIFSNNIEKNKLENLLYPYLEIELKKFENTNYKENILVYDVPLIYETKTEKRYDKILLAHCNGEVQRERVLARDKISDSLFEKILASQLSFDDKIKFKPKIINTNNKLLTLIKVCSILIKILIKLKSKNGKEKINT